MEIAIGLRGIVVDVTSTLFLKEQLTAKATCRYGC
jgi:hypothetical protein